MSSNLTPRAELLAKVNGIASRLEFIEGGLGIEDPNPRGAALALEDTEMAALDLVERVERMTQCARELAGMPTETNDSEVDQDQCAMASEVTL